MFTRLCILFVLITTSISSTAQKSKDKYKEEAELMRKEVWGWTKPEFAVRDIPATYAGSSKVIIARHTEISADSKKKTSFGLTGFNAYRQLYLTEITREAIKINDKAAIADYSEMSYTQIEKSSGNYSTNTSSVYVGVRVIKPDGSIKEISTDDIVLTKDEKSTKEAKVAIPDLQAGDIIDYFFAKQEKIEQSGLGDIANYLFTLFDDVPVMFYSIHAEFGKKYAVEYRCYNGAPDFKKSTTTEEDNVFDMVVKNIPASTENNLWMSPYRQLPIIRLNIEIGYKGKFADDNNLREPGKVYANPSTDGFIKDRKATIKNYETGNTGAGKIVTGILSGNISKYYKEVLKNKKELPLDSVVAELYYVYRYGRFGHVESYTNIDAVVGSANREFNPNFYLYDFGAWLRLNDIDCEMVFVTPNSGPRFKEVLRTIDINWLLLIHGAKDRFIGITDIFSPAFFLPSEYENTKQAMTIKITGKSKKDIEEGSINIPASNSAENARIEKIDVTPAANGTDLQIDRRTVLKGYYKPDVQKNLILFEDFCNAERKLLGADNTIIEQLQAIGNKKSYAPELKTAFDNARSKQKDAFASEAKDWFGLPVINLTNHRVVNMGIRHNNPDFIYSSKFTIEGVIKKAGNNMIVDIGKLQGSPLNIPASNRKRKYDIYMPFARSLQTQINFQIPDGYTAEGINELNKKVENETGYFITEATSDGKTVTIKIKKSYNHSFEPVGNWEKLLAFVDAANEWSNAKILLKKK